MSSKNDRGQRFSDDSPRVDLEWDDDPLSGTGRMMGVFAMTEHAPGSSYSIVRWHGERMVPEWTSAAGTEQGENVKYGSGAPITIIIDGKEERLSQTRTQDEAIAACKLWCERHAASILGVIS